jgi:TPR repeat protein
VRRRGIIVIASLTGALVQPEAALAESPSADPQGPAPAVTTAVPRPFSAGLQAAAARGDAQAQYDLAVALDCGCGVRRDEAGALVWLRRAANQGHVNAQGALGWKYMTGSGVRPDDAQAFEWLRRAAERGNTAAQNNLGILYASGRGVAADPGEAEKWFRSAADKGAADAQRNLEALRAGRGRDLRPTAQPPLSRT